MHNIGSSNLSLMILVARLLVILFVPMVVPGVGFGQTVECSEDPLNVLRSENCGFDSGVGGWSVIWGVNATHNLVEGNPKPGSFQIESVIEGEDGDMATTIRSPCVRIAPSTTFNIQSQLKVLDPHVTAYCGHAVTGYSEDNCTGSPSDEVPEDEEDETIVAGSEWISGLTTYVGRSVDSSMDIHLWCYIENSDDPPFTLLMDNFIASTPELPIEINAGHAGAWFDPETPGQGLLIDVEPEEQFMFVSWFTFTAASSDHPFEQHWFTAQGNYIGNTAELVIYETLGGQFDDPQEVSTDPVGEVTLSFANCGNGELSYTIDTWDLQGYVPLQRVIPGTENVCYEQAGITAEPLDPNDGWDGAWFDEATPGQGFLIDGHPNPEGDDFVFVAWFTYGENTASRQRWLTAQGPLRGSTADLVVYETTGGGFDDPKPTETVPAGSLTIDFTDCSNALLTYSLTDEALEGSIDIKRAIPGAEALCVELTTQDVANDPAIIGTWNLSTVDGDPLPPGLFVTWVFKESTVTTTSELDCVSVIAYSTAGGVIRGISLISHVGSQCAVEDDDDSGVVGPYTIVNNTLTVIVTDEDLDPPTATFVFIRGG
jgi:hypothetical protein